MTSTASGHRVIAPDQIGGQYAAPAEAARLGDSPALSAAAAADIFRAIRVVIPQCGDVPHLEHPRQFLDQLLPFLAA